MTPRRSGMLFLVMIALHLACAFAYSGIRTAVGRGSVTASLLISEGAVFVPALIFALMCDEKRTDIFGLHRVPGRVLLWVIPLIVISYPAVAFCNAVSLLYTDNAVESMSEAVLSQPFWLMVLIIGVTGPLCEELSFRGAIYSGLRASGRVRGAVFFSALLFGLMHLNLNQAGYAFVLGLVFALMREKTGSIWPSVLFHVLFNSGETGMMYLSARMFGSSASAQGSALCGKDLLFSLMVLGGLAGAGLAISHFIIERMGELCGYTKIPEPKERAVTLPLVFGIAAACGIIVGAEMMA